MSARETAALASHDDDADGHGGPGVLEGEEGRGDDLDAGHERQADGEEDEADAASAVEPRSNRPRSKSVRMMGG